MKLNQHAAAGAHSWMRIAHDNALDLLFSMLMPGMSATSSLSSRRNSEQSSQMRPRCEWNIVYLQRRFIDLRIADLTLEHSLTSACLCTLLDSMVQLSAQLQLRPFMAPNQEACNCRGFMGCGAGGSATGEGMWRGKACGLQNMGSKSQRMRPQCMGSLCASHPAAGARSRLHPSWSQALREPFAPHAQPRGPALCSCSAL